MKRLLPHAVVAAALLASQIIAVAQDPGFLPAQPQSSRSRQQIQPAASQSQAQPGSMERDDVAASASRITSMTQLDDSRPLRIKDQVVLRIVEDKAEPKSLVVQDSGDIFAPYIGLVKAAGRTPRQLALYMKGELEKQYFQQATVIVALERAYIPGRGGRQGDGFVPDDMGYITIYGQVIRQGKYEFAPEDQLTASQAILRAGGFAPFAKDKAVKIIRKIPGKGNVTIVVNLRDVMTKGRLEKDITIYPNDTIIVEEKLINF
ncbi:protein involved in polysaccharide export with SLBB domain [Roseimicrobium gellanilyticum]|uniref:Protein involved in polysaccharide export with SLBB domain n=1 Tax=Roseimicrobium gellanilyticum TaxID=748857 RepID=A0A366HHV0_9BACT|nr:polysaccharide biosynthesis/export family protein [Roseimicrobium gellanilyticum]RBP41179.1 protein involved in polysaccharide export with SLBB domain [Roseimicrobium gellanilyticum]